jgi:hypothetical protein
MPSSAYASAAWIVLLVHVGVVIFNVAGMVAIPVGAWRGWAFVRHTGWRLVHLLSMMAVALQAVLGKACFLTLWQAALEQRAGTSPGAAPLLYRWVNMLLFWPVPLWVFTIVYGAALIYVALLWHIVPPRKPPA